MKKAYKSPKIYCEDKVVNGYLVVDGKKIEAVETSPAEGLEIVDLGNKTIIPGIFDTHTHGSHGYALRGFEGKKREENIYGYLKAIAGTGVANVFPTCGVDTIEAVAEIASKEYDGANICGIHSEGPWLNRVGEKGIKTGWPEVSLDTAKKMVDDAKGLLKLVAAAPEIEGIGPVLEYFKSQGVQLAYAHSDMQYDDAAAALDKYFDVATHLGNVMTGLHHRDVGGLGACLLDDNLQLEIICDGLHINLKMIELYFRINDYSRYMMISDSSNIAGAPVGKYKGWGSSVTINMTEEGFLLSNTGRLCGSSKPVIYGMKNLVQKLHIPLETVVKLSALNPCKQYGLDKEKGSIKAGKSADFVVIDEDFNVHYTFVNGKKIYDSAVDTALFNPEYLAANKLD